MERDKIEKFNERTRQIEARANEPAEPLAREATRQVAKRGSIERIEEALYQQELQFEHEEQRIQDELYASPTPPRIPIRVPETASALPKQAPTVTDPPCSPAYSTRGFDPLGSPAHSVLEPEDHPPRSPERSTHGIDHDASTRSPTRSTRGLEEPGLSAVCTSYVPKSPSKVFLSFRDSNGTGIEPKKLPSRTNTTLPSTNFSIGGGSLGGFGQRPTMNTKFGFGPSPAATGFGVDAGSPPSNTAGGNIGFGAAPVANTRFRSGSTQPFGSVMNAGGFTGSRPQLGTFDSDVSSFGATTHPTQTPAVAPDTASGGDDLFAVMMKDIDTEEFGECIAWEFDIPEEGVLNADYNDAREKAPEAIADDYFSKQLDPGHQDDAVDASSAGNEPGGLGNDFKIADAQNKSPTLRVPTPAPAPEPEPELMPAPPEEPPMVTFARKKKKGGRKSRRCVQSLSPI
ncbi:hypothetical protein M408DRAFT_173699 [Serendipita vermifera MAFF 305830]|uniref:Uncharacterized protein n=1 Tax=Serendipita vermifera MAFF 305830 TaxID=933852 RepID=A0A0C3B6Q9_SERVB|nr:hypothetical protein M408DRAFT_173699 [Serendipita vermifera MAFF 305830]